MRHTNPLPSLVDIAYRITREEPHEADLTQHIAELFRTDAGTALCQYALVPTGPSVVTVAEAHPPTTSHIELCRHMASSHPGWTPALRSGSSPVLRLSDLVSLRRFWGTEPYLVFHGPEEGRFPANVILHMSSTELTFLALQRRTRDFSDTEMADLSLVQQVLAAAFAFRETLDRIATKLSDELSPAVASVPRHDGPPPVGKLDAALTKREAEILALAAAGWTNHRIAGRLGISERTVRKHLGNAYEKTKSSGRVEAAVWWQRHM